MARTDAVQVAAIIEVDGAIDLAPFITVAGSLVDEIATYYDDPRLLLIETWLSAHFYAQRDPRAAAEKAGPVSANYQSVVDLGLNNTHYGQMALALDTKGILRALTSGRRRTLTVSWLGKPEQQVLAEAGLPQPIDIERTGEDFE